MNDWKTTTGGVLIAIGSGLTNVPNKTTMLVSQILVGIGGLLLGVAAPDRR